MSRAHTPASHDFPTRRYDLVKEFVIALVVVLVLSGALSFSAFLIGCMVRGAGVHR